ncbi:hypothetical protein D3C80_2143910 [compost metagenome]
MLSLHKKGLVTFSLKFLIPDRDHFVNQKAIKINGKRQGESEASPHAGRIRLNREQQMLTQLGKIINFIDSFLNWAIV